MNFENTKKLFKSSLWLEYISLIYLIIPYFIFWLGWLKPWLSIPLVLITIFSLHKTLKYYLGTEPTFNLFALRFFKNKKNIITLSLIIFLVFFWVYISGSGGFSLQNGDYQKHNAVLKDLTELSWPTSYSGNLSSIIYYLSYYIAYYLPSALIGKFFGLAAATNFLFCWTFLGCLLGVSWFLRLINKFSFVFVIFFILFSGMDIIGELFMGSIKMTDGVKHIEWWAQFSFWQYSANTSLLFWVPQHAIPGWIITAMLVEMIREKRYFKSIPATFIFAMSSLWSPFVMLGLIPFWFVLYLRKGIKRLFSFENIVGAGAILLISGLFYKANLPDHRSGFLWQFHNLADIWPKYFLFCLLEFAIFGIAIWPLFKTTNKSNRYLAWTTAIALLLIPFYIMGYYNDFGMRSSIPALFVLQVMIASFLGTKHMMRFDGLKVVLIIALLFGSFTAGLEMARSLKHFGQRRVFRSMHVPQMPYLHVAKQYFANNRSFFFKYLTFEGKPFISIPKRVLDLLPKEKEE